MVKAQQEVYTLRNSMLEGIMGRYKKIQQAGNAGRRF